MYLAVPMFAAMC